MPETVDDISKELQERYGWKLSINSKGLNAVSISWWLLTRDSLRICEILDSHEADTLEGSRLAAAEAACEFLEQQERDAIGRSDLGRKIHGMPYCSKSDEDVPDDKCRAYELGYEDAVEDARQLVRENGFLQQQERESLERHTFTNKAGVWNERAKTLGYEIIREINRYYNPFPLYKGMNVHDVECETKKAILILIKNANIVALEQESPLLKEAVEIIENQRAELRQFCPDFDHISDAFLARMKEQSCADTVKL